MTLIQVEMDVTWMNPYQSDQGTPNAHGLVHTPMASGGHPILGATLGLPLTQWMMSTRPGIHRGLGITFGEDKKMDPCRGKWTHSGHFL